MALKFTIVPVTPLQQNCSVIWCDETMEGAVVDPGGDLHLVTAAIEANKVNITQILLTHGHLDHAGGATELAQKLAVPINGPHIEDKFWLDAIERQSQMYGVPGMLNCTPDRWLTEQDTIAVGHELLKIVHCPGHTPGHLVFYHEGTKLAMVGDVIFAGSIGRTDFPRGNHQQLLDSIADKLWPLGNDMRFIPGHGNMSDFGRERASNPFVSDVVLGR